MKILNRLENIVKKIQGEKNNNIPTKNNIINNDNKLSVDELVSLTFSINTKGQLFIDGKWINSSIETANILAEFIFLICSGSLYKNIFNYLGVISSINEEYFEFAQNVALLLQEKLEKDLELTEQPIIKPSQAFSFNNQNKQNPPPILNNNDNDDDLEIDNEDL